MVVLPYIKGLGEKLRRIFREGDIKTVLKDIHHYKKTNGCTQG